MCGTAPTGSRSWASLGTSASTSEARIAFDIAQAIQPSRTNSTPPTAIQAAAPGNWVSSNMSHAITSVEGMVNTQATTISATTRTFTPLPEATPDPITDDAAA